MYEWGIIYSAEIMRFDYNDQKNHAHSSEKIFSHSSKSYMVRNQVSNAVQRLDYQHQWLYERERL